MRLRLVIAAGGAYGAVFRHRLGAQILRWLGAGFPYGTLTVNVVGAFLLGALIEIMALRWQVSLEMRAFMTVGVLGAFTTFSTFSLEVVLLFERGAILSMTAYLVASVGLAVLALFAGLHLFRAVLT